MKAEKNLGGRQKGTYKTGGRQKGTLNKVTAGLKEILAGIVEHEFDDLPTRLDTLDPSERINALVKLLPYVLPKAMEIDLTTMQPKSKIEDYLADLLDNE